MEKSQVKWLYISIGFSLLVLVIILFLTINENTVQYLREINPFFLLLAFLTHVLTMCFWALRVQKMSGSLGYRIGFFYSLNLVFANLLVAAITPSQAGGEPVRIHELYRAERANWGCNRNRDHGEGAGWHRSCLSLQLLR